MKQKGLFCFILVLLFIEVNVILLGFNNFQQKELGEANSLLLQQEKASFVRAEIEQNIDILIDEKMRKELGQKNIDPGIIKDKLGKEIIRLFNDFESIYRERPAVNFYSARVFL